jgi:predicted oxidoreductase
MSLLRRIQPDLMIFPRPGDGNSGDVAAHAAGGYDSPPNRTNMKTQTIGKSSIVSTRLAYGCWRILGTWNPAEITPERQAQARQTVIAAYEAGYTLFDHADIYCAGMCEKSFGDVLQEIPGMRQTISIATKCGIRFAGDPKPGAPFRYDFSSEHIIRSCEQSLRRLRTDIIDIYQLHRPDYLMNPEEIAGAFYALKRQGKVREFGVSNFTPTQLSLLQQGFPLPLAVHQVQISLTDLHCLNDGTMEQCLSQKITPLAWSPLGGGMLGTGVTALGSLSPKLAHLPNLLKTLDAVAAEYSTTRTVIALAWLLKHPAGIIPVVGSANPDRIHEATKADEVSLSREDWYRLLEAARGERLP